MSEILPFKKSVKHYEYSKQQYLYFILAGLNYLHPGDHQAKGRFIMEACPFISIGRLEQFSRKVSAAINESNNPGGDPDGELAGAAPAARETTEKKELPMIDKNEAATPAAGSTPGLLCSWSARAFTDLSPTIIQTIRLCLETGALTNEEVHHLAMCKLLIAEKVGVKEKLTPAQLNQWHGIWGKLMSFLLGQGVETVTLTTGGCPSIPTGSIVHPWMTH